MPVPLKSLSQQYSELLDARDEVERREAEFLRSAGWHYTSEMGALWLWRKEIDGKTVYVDQGGAMHFALLDLDPSEEED